MKPVIWITLLALIAVECQEQIYSINPKFVNPLLFLQNPYELQEYGLSNLVQEVQSRVNSENKDVAPRLGLFYNYGAYPTGGSGYSPSSPIQPPVQQPVRQLWLKTYYYTSVVVTTIPSISYCISMNELVNAAAPCSRRKREIMSESLDDADEIIDPSAIKNVEPTLIHDPQEVLSASVRGVRSAPVEISSSLEEDTDSKEADVSRSKRLFNGLHIFGVTSIITSYSFVTQTVARPVTLCDAAAAPCLLCLPPGYGTC